VVFTTNYIDGTEEEVIKRFQALENDPAKKMQIDALLAELQNENFVEKTFDDITDELDIKDFDLNNLDDEQTKDLIYELLTRQVYAEQQGEYIATGDRVLDKFVHYRLMDPINITKGILYSLLILKVLCETRSPGRGLAAALGMVVFDRLVLDQPLYWLRDKSINM
jgi:hypothetical protein